MAATNNSSATGPVLTLYSREYCHLCSDMLSQLCNLRPALKFDVDVIDVDSDPILEERYGIRVPLLLHGELELAMYHLDVEAIRAYLGRQMQGSA